MDRPDADSFQCGKVKPVFSYVLGCFEIDMGEYNLLAIERHDLESGAHATVADFLGVKTTSTLRQAAYDTFNQRCFPAAGATGEQNFFGHNRCL